MQLMSEYFKPYIRFAAWSCLPIHSLITVRPALALTSDSCLGAVQLQRSRESDIDSSQPGVTTPDVEHDANCEQACQPWPVPGVLLGTGQYRGKAHGHHHNVPAGDEPVAMASEAVLDG